MQIWKYKHYKWKTYRVIGTAVHSETFEEFVVYSDISKNWLWIRSKKMFLEKVLFEWKLVPRFEYIWI